MVEVTPVEEDARGSGDGVEEMDVDDASQSGDAAPEAAVDGDSGSATPDARDASHELVIEAPREMTGAAVFTLESYDLRGANAAYPLPLPH